MQLYHFRGEELTIMQIAERLNVSYPTAWNYCNSGRVKAAGTVKAQTRQKDYDTVPSPKYDAFIAEMLQWSADEKKSQEVFNSFLEGIERQAHLYTSKKDPKSWFLGGIETVKGFIKEQGNAHLFREQIAIYQKYLNAFEWAQELNQETGE